MLGWCKNQRDEEVIWKLLSQASINFLALQKTGVALASPHASAVIRTQVAYSVLLQICSAYKTRGGTTAVVLSSRPKIEMEDTFRRIIPDDRRFGTNFVFRAGSPLVPSDLRKVAASAAAAVIVVADNSR